MSNEYEKTYDEIMTEIKSQLTDDKEKNSDYLLEQSEKYKKHPNAKLILEELGKLLLANLDEEEMADMKDMLNEIQGLLDNGIKYVQSGQLKEAEEEFLKFIDEVDELVDEDSDFTYCSSANPIEYMLNIDGEKGKYIREIGINFSLGYAYLGMISFQNGQLDRANEMLDEAIKWNPNNAEALFEKIDIMKVKGDIENYKLETDKMIDKIYDSMHLAHYYRNLGYYYATKLDYQTAKALYQYSMMFDNSANAQNELNSFNQTINNTEVLDINTIKTILSTNNIPLKISAKVINILNKTLDVFNRGEYKDKNWMDYIEALLKFYNNIA